MRSFSLLASLLTFGSSLAFASFAFAQPYTKGDIHIDSAYARPTAPAQPAGAVYLTIENRGNKADRLLSISTPAAESAEVHTMSMVGNVMKMREVGEIELKPAEKVQMVPGDGYHVMLLGLKQSLKPGDKLPLSLTFKNAGKMDVQFVVEDKNAKQNANGKPTASSHHHHH